MAEYTEKDIVEQVRDCYKYACDVENEQREREREDLEFQIPENQWTPEARKARAASQFQPARPMLSVSLLKQPMQLVYNQFTRARLGVQIHPVSEKANKENAEVKQGLYRRIERDGGAQSARGWAFLRALACGRGWYRVTTAYDEDADQTGDAAWDQEIRFERILNQENVYMDPAAQKADFSDAKWALEVGWYDYKDFKERFPRAKASETAPLELEGYAQQAPEWVRTSRGTKEPAFLVARYWYKEIERQELTGPDGQTRERENVTVYYCDCNGFEVLRPPQKWNGKYIPLVPVIGEELIPIEGRRIWQGMIRPARDAQMAYNYAISSAVEDISRVSKTPYIGWAGQFETDRDKWNTLNVNNYPYVEADTVLVDGKPAPSLPQPFPIDGSKLQLSVQMAGQFREMVQASTAVHEPSLGELPSRKDAQSGRAILALQQQSDAGTSQFAQNLTDVTLPYESLVVLDLMKTIYDRPARVTSIVTGEDENRAVMLGAPFVMDPNTGQPTEAPENPQAKLHSLTDGKYGISVTFGKNPQTRMEAGQQFTAEVISSAPELMGIAGDLVFKFRDEPGAKEISDRMNKMIRAQHPEFFQDEQTGAEQAQAENAALKQQLQMTTQQLQQAVQAIQTRQVEQQAKIQSEQIKAQADIEIAKMNNAAKVLVARITSDADVANQQAEAQEELLSTGIKIQAEAATQGREHAHEREMSQQQMAHEQASREDEMAHEAMVGAADAHQESRPEVGDGGAA